MRVLRTGVDLEVAQERISEAGLGKHALDCVTEYELGFPAELVGGVDKPLAARVTRVPYIDLVGHFLSRESYLVGIDDDNVVTAIHVGSVTGFVLAAQDLRHLRRKTAQNLPLRVDDDTFLVDRLRVCGDCFVNLLIHFVLRFVNTCCLI